ncbi:hypothetical protein ACQKJZ_04855 [Sphingomonas sp. NPDC019816]|uniref:hypothetical protein n=1 Tax=Sphingomonas sp. NPDC019816 TaxID=3390679 RepID=UPI003D0046D1
MTGMIRSTFIGTLLAMLIGLAHPASAQFYLKNYDHAASLAADGLPVVVEPLPGATDGENDAALIWTMRAALNVAALQCQFEPTLLADGNYNAMLVDHVEELAAAWTLLGMYFDRVSPTPRDGRDALDRYGTRLYSRFSTVRAQYEFCRVAGSIGEEILFSPRAQLAVVAGARMNELRSSLIYRGEQLFDMRQKRETVTLPRLDAACWDRKARWRDRTCGPDPWAKAPIPGESAGT